MTTENQGGFHGKIRRLLIDRSVAAPQLLAVGRAGVAADFLLGENFHIGVVLADRQQGVFQQLDAIARIVGDVVAVGG